MIFLFTECIIYVVCLYEIFLEQTILKKSADYESFVILLIYPLVCISLT